MCKDKTKIILLSVLAILFSLLTCFALVNYNYIYYLFDNFAITVFILFPLLSLALIIYSSVFIFKNSKISFITPVAIALIGCVLAFYFSNDASLSKIESDYLKNEAPFNNILTQAIEQNPRSADEVIIEIESSDLKYILPEQKVMIANIGANTYAYFFIALDVENRYEGYAYIPYGTPLEWNEYGAFSDPLDIEKTWYYMSLLK